MSRWNPLTSFEDIKWRALSEFIILVGKKVIKEGPEVYAWIRSRFNEKQYAFVPNKAEAVLLQRMRFDSTFVQISLLVPNYKYIDLIRTGLLIGHYHDEDAQGYRDRVSDIKAKIHKRTDGARMLKIANLASTPYFDGIGFILQKYKNEGYTEETLEGMLDIIIENWEKNALLVTNADRIQDVMNFVQDKMEDKESLFFICGMRASATKVETAERRIIREELAVEHGYNLEKIGSTRGNTPRVIIIFQRDITV